MKSADIGPAKLATTVDPYEVPVVGFQDDLDMWPAITHMHVGMCLVFSPSPYTGEVL